MKSLIVSLVSDQTIPNIQFIKERLLLSQSVEDFDLLFVTTEKMEKKGTREWIINTLKYDDEKCFQIEVDEYDPNSIVDKLNSVNNFLSYESIYVNLTGGTKVMTMIVRDYFSLYSSQFFYVLNNKEYMPLYKSAYNNTLDFNSKITLFDYLSAYGYSFKKHPKFVLSNSKNIDNLYKAYINGVFDEYHEVLIFLRSKRGKKINSDEYVNHGVSAFIDKCEFILENDNQLSKSEVEFITGEWFEEYIGRCVKNELNLSEEDIAIGVKLEKGTQERSTVNKLLGATFLEDKSPKNEFDVMFIYNNTFYVIECKTSIISKLNGKEYNILGETLYKADSLKSKFGLFAKSYIFTLTDFKHHISGGNKDKAKKMEELIKRADLSGITIADKDQLLNNEVSDILLPNKSTNDN